METKTDNVTFEVDYQKAAIDEWIATLTRMWDAVDKPVDDRRLMVYVEEFKDIPLELLGKAVGRAIRNNGVYSNVPTVGALWSAIRKEAGEFPNMEVMDVVDLWDQERYERIVYRFGQ